MSVQAGIWQFDGRPADRKLLAQVSDAVASYGPDGENSHFADSIGILYRPFHTTTESHLEHQPYVSARGLVVTWDGRLDNREELISQLGGTASRYRMDVSILAAAYDRWGPHCFANLIGDWALSIWNPREKELILARDFMGIRRLLYCLTKERFIWCTRLDPIVLLSRTSFTLDEDYIAGYLAFYPEAHLTPYREIRGVPPGKYVRVCDKRATVHSYWAFCPQRQIEYKSDAEYEEHFRHVFRQAVRRRLRADSPILAELSGGLDSSSIVCMADDILARGGAEAPKVDTLSFYDPREPDGDERPYFSKVEAARGRIGHHCDAGAEGISIPRLLPTFSPCPGSLGDEKAQATDFRRGLFQGHKYRVSLSGIGGDEFLGGVPKASPQLANLILQFRPVELARQLMAWSLEKRRPWIQLLGEACVLLLPVWARARLTAEAKVAPWIDVGFAKRHRLGSRQLGPTGNYGFALCSRREYAQTIVALSWQMSFSERSHEAWEERRYPYLDQTLLEFLLSIPAEQLLRPGKRRSLMRRALSGLVPQEILNRRTKAIAARRMMVAVQKSWEILEVLFESSLTSQLGFINPIGLRQCLVRAKNGDAPQLVRMVKAIALELWLQDVMRRGLIHSPQELHHRRVALAELRSDA